MLFGSDNFNYRVPILVGYILTSGPSNDNTSPTPVHATTNIETLFGFLFLGFLVMYFFLLTFFNAPIVILLRLGLHLPPSFLPEPNLSALAVSLSLRSSSQSIQPSLMG